MHAIDVQIMNVSKPRVTIEDFTRLLDLCMKTEVAMFKKGELYVYFPEGLCSFPKDIFKNIQEIEQKVSGVIVSSFVCLSSGIGYVGLHVEGNDFVTDQFSVLTSVLVILKGAYEDVRFVDFSYDDDSSNFLIKFNGYLGN